MEPLEEDNTAPPPSRAVSFTFQKKVSSSKVRRDVESSRDKEENEGRDFVLSLEGKEIQSVKPKLKEKEYVVPLIRQNRWILPPKKDGEESRQGEGKSVEEVALDREAAEAIMKDIQEAKLRGLEPQDSGLVVPLIMQNKPPVVEGREGDELADVELRPEQSTLEEYETMPISSFGEAVLKGMGWKKGEAIGRTNKGLTEPIEFIPRLGGLGLGATPRAPRETKKRIKKPGEEERKYHGPYIDKDGRVRHVKKVGEEIPEQPLEGFCVGNYVQVMEGPHQGLYGKIVSSDEDNARVVLRLSINGQNVSFSQHHLEVVNEKQSRADQGTESHHHGTEKREKKYGLIRKRKDGDRLPSPGHEGSPKYRSVDDAMVTGTQLPPLDLSESSRSLKKGRDRESDVSGPESSSKRVKYEDRGSKVRTSGHEYRYSDGASHKPKGGERVAGVSQKSGLSKEKCWMASDLRVRVVDRKFKKGRFYNTKVVIIDVVSPDTCVCRTEEGRLLEGVKQHMLETVIPKTPGASVMVVGGKRKGQIATLLEQDRANARAVVNLIVTKEILKLDFEDLCEYIGEIEDL